MARLTMDLGPLRSSRDFRIIFWARVVALLGISLTLVALSIQVYDLTGSSLAVGMTNLIAGVTLLGGTLAGGVMADRYDRRQLLVVSRSGAAAVFAALTFNALADQPQLWIVYLCAAVIGVVDGIAETALLAITPDLVRSDELAAAGALTAITTQLATIVGPTIGGAIIAGPGVTLCYGITCAATVVQVAMMCLVERRAPAEAEHQHPLRAMLEGLQYIHGNRLVASLLLIDLIGSLFALQYAVFPELGTEALHGGPRTVGLMYSAPAVGAFLGALLSGWVSHSRRPGYILTGAVLVWGAGMAAAGASPALPVALVMLGLAGVGMIYCDILIRAMIQQHTPSRLMGRVSSFWLGQATVGMAGGNALAGGFAGVATARIAVVTGGLLCVTAGGLVAGAVPELRRAGPTTTPTEAEDEDEGPAEAGIGLAVAGADATEP